jgi:hypothetical protein
MGTVGLIVILALGLGSGHWVSRGYDIESCGHWLRDGGESLEKKNHVAM